jgi:ERCC4-type nuclease
MAVDLLQHFGSIPQILHSRRTQKDLMEINGIGRTKAKKILDLRTKF